MPAAEASRLLLGMLSDGTTLLCSDIVQVSAIISLLVEAAAVDEQVSAGLVGKLEIRCVANCTAFCQQVREVFLDIVDTVLDLDCDITLGNASAM